MILAILIIVSLCLVLILADFVVSLRIATVRKAADWLPMLADEGLALAQHTKAHHKANKLEFTVRDEEEEAIRWMLERAASLKVKVTRAQAAKLVAIRRSK